MAEVPLAVVPSEPQRRREVDRDRIAADLRARIAGEVRFGPHDRMLYATDASIYQVEPLGVVIPRTIADVEAVIRYAADHRLPVLPRGAGTSLAGQTVNVAIVIDFSVHLRRLLGVDPAGRTADVEPGLVLNDLETLIGGSSTWGGTSFAPGWE